MKIVVDTNVIVSGLLSPNGPPAAILSLLLGGKLTLLYDVRILQEYIEVLGREKFDFNPGSVDALLDYFRVDGEFAGAEPTKVAFTDIDDKAFYEVLVTSDADYLITGNLEHFPEEKRIVTPRQFLTRYMKTIAEQ